MPANPVHVIRCAAQGEDQGNVESDPCDPSHLSGGDLARNLAPRRLQRLEHHRIARRDGQPRRQRAVPAGVDGLAGEVVGEVAYLGHSLLFLNRTVR